MSDFREDFAALSHVRALEDQLRKLVTDPVLCVHSALLLDACESLDSLAQNLIDSSDSLKRARLLVGA
ncbi:hypothetical protein [Rhodococcus qingshengii]|uniref:hypothetical protein n=1 Tax=Rhodococcus qingshengii TaxID=334542 RepID=UPI001F1713B0|nr:hypothetical protein [Rhodococcus qingshengii]